MQRWRTLRERANVGYDVAGLVAFRVLFGALMCAGALRFLANDWVTRFFVTPDHFLPYPGLFAVPVLPEPYMSGAFVLMAVSAAMIALGAYYRVATVLFFLSFTYVELIDVSNYLNHYYLVSLLAALMVVLPLHRAYSIDAWRRPESRVDAFPAWMTWLLRFQVGVVYFFAGLAKLQPDWLLHAQPLNIWLSARTDIAIIGPYLDEIAVAYAMSWAGFLYDLTVPFWLLWRRSRPYAYAVLLVFHFFTHVFFQIGLFPLIMTVGAVVFFEPDWPRRLIARLRRARGADAKEAAPDEARKRVPWPLGAAGVIVLSAWALLHVAMPLRTHAYGGDVLWHEQGMRWSWRVMVREKNGSVTYRVRVDGESREREVSPRRYLTNHQEREMSAQPDLILQLAHRIARDFEAEGHDEVEVYVDAFASLNGRPMARLIDPEVDLAQVRDGIAPASWILPAPEGPPIRLRSHRERLAAAGDSR